MLYNRTFPKVSIWTLLFIVVIGGILSSCEPFQQASIQQTYIPTATHTASTRTAHSAQRSVPAHNVSYTSAAYYAQLLAKAQKQHTQSAPGSSGPSAHFTINIMAANTKQGDATNGVPVKVCATSDDDGAAEGEDVFLTADNGASFLTNLVTLDSTGCESSKLFAPNKGNVTISAAINYITPVFNRGGDEAGTYDLQAVAKSQVDITTTSKPISAAAAFGVGRGSSPFAGESVNLALGNYIYQHADFALPVHSGTISLTRTYNSLNTSDGPFGVGWSFPYYQYLTIFSDNSVSVTYGDGHHEDYIFNNGAYTPVAGAGILSQLTEFGGVYTVLHKDQSQDRYDASGKLISVFNSKGDAISFHYNDSGTQLLEIVDGFSGRGLGFVYDSSGHINSMIDTLYQKQNPTQPKVYTYTYDGNNHLAFVTDPLGNTISYSYSNSQNGSLLTTVKDAIGNIVITNSYDSSNRVISQKNALGATTTFTYKTGSTIVTDPNMNSSTYAYDFFYRQISFTDPMGNVTDYTYDNNGELRTVTDGNNNTVEYTYDVNGNLKSIVDAIGVHDANPSGHMTTYAYDKQNHLLEIVDADGHKTIYRYDDGGNVIKVIDAHGGVTQFGYEAHMGLTSSTGPDGGQHTITYGYDAYGDQTTITDGLGKTQTTNYNADGLPVEITDADGHSIFTAYDLDGHIVSVTNGIKATVTYFYDQNGNRVSVINADKEPTNYVYDKLNRLTIINNPDNTSIHYFYDADGNLVKQLDQAGHPTTYTYNKNNQVMSVTDALGHTTRYTYDHVGNVITRTNANNQTTNYVYNEKNELIEVDYADGTFTQFTYDGVGNRLTMTDATGTSSYVFDDLNRLVATTDSMGHSLSMSYDPTGNLTSMVYPDSRIVNYSYDSDNRLISVTDWANRITTYTYDAAGNLIKTSLPNHVVTTYTYDAGDRLTGVSNMGPGGAISAFAYTLDGIGERTMVIASGSAAEVGNTLYSYDSMGHLLKASYPDGSYVTYSYDNNGNRSAMVSVTGKTTAATTPTPSIATPATPLSTTATYSYNAVDELTQVVSGATETSMSYDSNGNLTTSKTGSRTISYQYNAQEELASVSSGTITVSNTYNGDGFRVSKGVTDGSSTSSTQYVLSPTQTPQVLEEDTSNGGTTDELYGSSLLASASMETTSAPSYYSYDGLGSVRDVTDSTGKVLGSYSYDAFGALRSSTGNQTEFQLNGQQVDAENGLTYLRSRYYDPTLGRFIMRDSDPGNPDAAQTLNHYVYSNSDPINHADPTGKDPLIIIGFIIGAIAGAVGSIIAQAISGKGINWAEVGFDAAIGGVVGAIIGFDPLAISAFGMASVGAVQSAGDYCFETCGTAGFSWEGLAVSAGSGAVTGAVFSKLHIGEIVGEGVGQLLNKSSDFFEEVGYEEIGNFLNRLSDSLIGEGGGQQNIAWPELVGNFVGKVTESIVQGVVGGIEGRLNLNDTLAERLKQLNAGGVNS